MMRLALAALVLAVPAGAAAQATSAAPAPATSDDAAIDALVREVYAVISGPAGPRDWDRFRTLFVPEARLVPTGDRGPMVLTVEAYIERAGAMMAKEGFFESELSRRVERYGNIAQVFSTYDSRKALGEPAFARGINSMQLVRVAGQWRVLHIVWQGETPTYPIPDAYLKAN